MVFVFVLRVSVACLVVSGSVFAASRARAEEQSSSAQLDVGKPSDVSAESEVDKQPEAGKQLAVGTAPQGKAQPEAGKQPEAGTQPNAAGQPSEVAPVPQPSHDGRAMDGHVFPFPLFVPSSFVVSSFGVRAGFESRTVPAFPTDSSTGASASQRVDLATVIATEGFDATVRVHRTLAVTLDIYGKARVGTNTATLLGTGADFEVGGNGGLLLSILRTQKFQLSVRGQGGYYRGQQAGIARFYQDVRAIAQQTVVRVIAGDANYDSERAKIDASLSQAARGLLTSANGLRAAGMLTAALTLSRSVGLQAVAGFSFESSSYASKQFQVTSNGSTRLRETATLRQGIVGLALDVSGAPIAIPLDLLLEYAVIPLTLSRQAMLGPAVQATVEQRVAAGLYYAGRSDLQLGFSGYALLEQVPELGAEARASGKPRDMGGLFSFRYIW